MNPCRAPPPAPVGPGRHRRHRRTCFRIRRGRPVVQSRPARTIVYLEPRFWAEAPWLAVWLLATGKPLGGLVVVPAAGGQR